MINRILIRMKVVQLLYSYLLTRNDFHIAHPYEKDTRDNRFAYETYLSILKFVLELSGYQRVGDSGLMRRTLSAERTDKLATSLAKSLSLDPELRDAIIKNNDNLIDFANQTNDVYQAIISSEVYKDFCKKRKKDLDLEVNLWTVLLDTVIAKNNSFVEACRKSDNFTLNGLSAGIELVKTTIDAFRDNRTSMANAKAALECSLDNAYELYHLLLLLPVEITKLQSQRIEAAKSKYMPSSEDLNPNTRFINNEFVQLVIHSDEMNEYLKEHPISFEGNYFSIKRMLDDVIASETYKDYMAAPTTDRSADCEVWRKLLKNVILPSDALVEMLESSSVYWNDDLEIMGTFALKTIRQASSSDKPLSLLPKYKDKDDEEFGAILFTDSISNRETYREYIDRFIDATQWDSDRLAFMDIVIMMVAISELLNFPSIPVPVTLNEYIEIANSYSTPRSGQFVNGMLFSIIKYLKSEGKLLKD